MTSTSDYGLDCCFVSARRFQIGAGYVMHQRRPLGYALLLAALLTTAIGCGSSAPPPASSGTKTAAQIVTAMKAAADSATSVRMTGSGKNGSSTLSFDLSFVGNSDLFGSFTENGARLTIEVVAGRTYIDINQGFLKIAGLPTWDCASVCGKWVDVPAAEARQIAGSITLSGLRSQVFGTISGSASATTSLTFVSGTYNGQPVLTAHGSGFTLDVASPGPPYPLFIAAPNGEHVTFSEWNSVPALTPPPASEVISL